jgi:hypothetical protein
LQDVLRRLLLVRCMDSLNGLSTLDEVLWLMASPE